VPIEDVKVGDKIWGLDKWSTVEGKAYKGLLPVSIIRLNNGSVVPLTADHKAYVLRCKVHGKNVGGDWRLARGGRCACPAEDREEIRVPVSELEVGMVLATPKTIPFGDDEWEPELSYLDGLYVADGWVDPSKREFCISGQDGCPKEEQKREVAAICEMIDVETRWHRKSIAIKKCPELFARMSRMGHYAPEKHLLSLNLDEACASEALRGVMADSGANTNGGGRTFTSTSRELAMQVRILHKMFGKTCRYSYIEKHGGFGKNPIWRLGVRAKEKTKLLRVLSVEHGIVERPCWDIQTDDHKVYLPEHDVTVSNCDDVACFIGALCRQLGRECEFVVVGFGAPGSYSHVFTRVKEPKSNRWIVCDPVAGTEEASMLRKVKTWKSVKVDK